MRNRAPTNQNAATAASFPFVEFYADVDGNEALTDAWACKHNAHVLRIQYIHTNKHRSIFCEAKIELGKFRFFAYV